MKCYIMRLPVAVFSMGGGNILRGGKWGARGREAGGEGEGSGGKGGGKRGLGTPQSTPTAQVILLDPNVLRTAKTLIRLGGCPG